MFCGVDYFGYMYVQTFTTLKADTSVSKTATKLMV